MGLVGPPAGNSGLRGVLLAALRWPAVFLLLLVVFFDSSFLAGLSSPNHVQPLALGTNMC